MAPGDAAQRDQAAASAPWRASASIAYAEQDGVKRHAPPDQGESTTW